MLIKSNSPFLQIFYAKHSNLYYDFRESLLTFSDKAGCPPSWCPSRLHSLLGAVTFTVAANCLPAACSRKEAHFARSHLFSQRTNSHDSCTLIPDVSETHTCTDTTTMYGHRQPQGREIFMNPVWASGWKQGHYFCYCLKKKSVKNQLSSHRGGIQWQAFGGLGSWRAELELCAALSDLQSQFDWFKAPVGPPSSFSSPSNSPHGGFLSGLAEGLSEDARGWRDYDIWIAFCSKYIHGT